MIIFNEKTYFYSLIIFFKLQQRHTKATKIVIVMVKKLERVKVGL